MKSIKSLSILFAACLAMSFAACEKGSENGGENGGGNGGNVTPDYNLVASYTDDYGIEQGISALKDADNQLSWTTVTKMQGKLMQAITQAFTYDSAKNITGAKVLITFADASTASAMYETIKRQGTLEYENATVSLDGSSVIISSDIPDDFKGITADTVRNSYNLALEQIRNGKLNDGGVVLPQ